MSTQAIKLRYNITQWDELKLNYWGIPKAYNTSMIYHLQHLTGRPLEKIDDACQWVHETHRSTFITQDQAIANGYENFTIMREPVMRFISMYKDIKRRVNLFGLRHIKDIDHFIDFIASQSDAQRNCHFRSQMYHIAKDGIIIPKIYTIYNIKERFDIPKLNTTNSVIILNKEQCERVLNIYKEDYDTWRRIHTPVSESL